VVASKTHTPGGQPDPGPGKRVQFESTLKTRITEKNKRGKNNTRRRKRERMKFGYVIAGDNVN